jgi:hypothetical protein
MPYQRNVSDTWKLWKGKALCRSRPVSRKPRFEYHKQSLKYVQRFLNNDSISSGGQSIGQNNIDLKLLNSSSLNEKDARAGSSARTEHQPPKLVVVGSNPTPPATANVLYIVLGPARAASAFGNR